MINSLLTMHTPTDAGRSLALKLAASAPIRQMVFGWTLVDEPAFIPRKLSKFQELQHRIHHFIDKHGVVKLNPTYGFFSDKLSQPLDLPTYAAEFMFLADVNRHADHDRDTYLYFHPGRGKSRAPIRLRDSDISRLYETSRSTPVMEYAHPKRSPVFCNIVNSYGNFYADTPSMIDQQACSDYWQRQRDRLVIGSGYTKLMQSMFNLVSSL